MYDNFKVTNYNNSLVSPEQFARPLSRLFTGDVIDGFTVVPKTGLTVTLQPGNAFVRYGSANVASARLISLIADFDLTHDTKDASNPRLDLIVVYVDNNVTLAANTPDGKGAAKAKIVKGVPNASPVAPNDTAIQASIGAGNPYIIVAKVQVDATVIASNKITDVRSLMKLGLNRVNTGATVTQTGAAETTALQTYANLATTTDSVTVTIGSNGIALVNIAARTSFAVGSGAPIAFVGVAVSGANTIAPSDDRALQNDHVTGNLSRRSGISIMYTGLAPGTTTFKMSYRVSANTGLFYQREISVVPL